VLSESCSGKSVVKSIDEGSSPSLRVLIIDKKPKHLTELRYLFGFVLGGSVQTLPALPEQYRQCLNLHQPNIIVVGSVADSITKVKFIRDVSNLDRPPFILCIGEQRSKHANSEAFLAGANEAVQRPVTVLELGLRLKAHLGVDFDSSANLESMMKFGKKAEICVAKYAGLTGSETKIARLLAHKAGQVVSRSELALTLDGKHWDYGDRKYDVHISSMRQKMNSAFGSKITIRTVRSTGYIMKLKDNFCEGYI
jgi:DNA-binding response OmpR family regulator